MGRLAILSAIVLFCLYFPSDVFSQDADTYTMRIAIGNPKQERHYGWTPFEVLQHEVGKRSHGRLTIQLISEVMGASSMDKLVMVRDGVVQGRDFADGHFSTIYPPIQVLSIPYLFANREIAWEVLDGPFGNLLIEDMAKKTGLRPLFWLENGGFRSYSNNKRAIHSPKDMKGLRIRTMESPLHMKIVSDLGGTPVPIDWGEVYNAIDSGIVDGQENSISTFLIPHFEKIQTDIVMDDHVYGTYTVLVNESWYQALPQDLKDLLREVSPIVTNANRGLSVVNEMESLLYLNEQGVNVYTPTLEEKALFKELTQASAITWLQANVGKEWVEQALQAAAEAEKKLRYGNKKHH